ncbi:acyltransferase [Pseudomonas sp. 2FG]|uniref:acyltransferase family protein n=1 Tax=Pseudomonas sp. 2FG TaxID=2502191 RepID=UPI0010F8BDC6|nr:acyltransferase [Pseudomonas sp. 2FG]
MTLTGLHSLRGLAALSIVVFHTLGIAKLAIPDQFGFINIYFGLGVPLFFTISCFSLFLSTSSRVGQDGWLSAYFFRRIFRIAPLFYSMTIFFLIFIYLKFGKTYSAIDIIMNFSLLYNLFPGKHESIVWAGWTIGVEVIFYLVVPYLLTLIKTIYSATAYCITMIALSAFAYTFYKSGGYPPGYAYMSFLGSIGVFSFGAPAYFLYKHLQKNPPINLGYTILAITLAIMVPVILFEGAVVPHIGSRSNLWGLVFALLIVSQCLKPFPLISNKAFAFLGKLSFGIYLCHPVIIYMLQPIYKRIYGFSLGNGVSFILCAILSIALVVVAAQIAHVLIERNGMRLGEWLISKRIARDNLATC